MSSMTDEQIAEALNKAKEHFEGRGDIDAHKLIDALVDVINGDGSDCKGCNE